MEKTKQAGRKNRTLLIKLICMASAFLLLAILSYLFMRASVHKSISLRATSIHEMTEDLIEAALSEYQSTLLSVAEEVTQMLIGGETEEGLQAYLERLSHFSFMDGNAYSGTNNFFGYFETIPEGPTMLYSSKWSRPDGYRTEDQPWYKLAMAAKGSLVATTPEVTEDDLTLFIYAKCIYDTKGRRLGIICMSVRLDSIGQRIVQTSLNQGGYGMLISQDDTILFHPSPDFRGRSMREPGIPFAFFADEINSGNVYEKSMVAYRGDRSVAFFTTLDNGWHLGLVTPQAQYYQDTYGMVVLIVTLALVFAAVFIYVMLMLDAARERSDEENRHKSAFLANMSHEIRTPINAIVGMTAIGKTAGTKDSMRHCFDKIDNASRHLLGVINDILDMSKIEANKIELSPTDFSFEKMLERVTGVINFRLDEKHQKLTIHIDENIPKVLFADDHRLANVITNLLSNAVKFSPENSTILLEARLLSEKGDDITLEIAVSDQGIGISKAQQEELFQPFQQAEASTTRRFGGTGLGLVISKSIVEMMDGKFSVTSELQKGATFTFTIKAKRSDEAKVPLHHTHSRFGGIRILAVDDDPDMLQYIQETTKGFGVACSVAASAGEALRLMEDNENFHIYFVDWKMPDIDGIALTRAIKERERDPAHSVVVMISAGDLRHVEDEARRAGVDRFLLKPIFPSAIADAINECIGIGNEKADSGQNIDGLFAGRCLLLADDVEINRDIVIAQLEPTGAAIDCAENGARAVEMFLRDPNKYDLILMDLQMPEMDGYDATRKIRGQKIPRAKEIPIIAMTANVFKEDVERCLKTGMNAHIGKPIDFDEMLYVLKKWLG